MDTTERLMLAAAFRTYREQLEKEARREEERKQRRKMALQKWKNRCLAFVRGLFFWKQEAR